MRRARLMLAHVSVVADCRAALLVGVRDRGVAAMHDATEGGVLGGLVELARACRHDLRVTRSAIPVCDEARAACALFGIDPYWTLSEGTLIVLARQAHAAAVVAYILKQNKMPAGKQALPNESDELRRIPTGIRDLDKLIGGLRVGGKTIIGAKPGMGKSLLLKQIGLNLTRRGVRFGVISVEESKFKIAENTLSNQSGVINNRIAFGKLDDSEWRRLAAALPELAQLPFFICDTVRKLSAIIAAIHVMKYEHGCEVIAVDHLHIIDGESDDNREREISKISAELKWVWKDLGVAGIEAAQLNRASGKDRPSLASLRDSGSLEQDADVVLLLHREDYYRDAKSKVPPTNVLECLIPKNKDGAPGNVRVNYDGARQQVSDLPELRDPFNSEDDQ